MNHLKVFLCCLGLCLASDTVYAVNYVKRVKKAKGIEITYQNVSKGKVGPGQIQVSIVGDKMVLNNVAPASQEKTEEEKLYKKPITKEYVDYSALKSYLWAELPNGDTISSVTPFVYGKNLKKVGEGEHLGLKCQILRTSINSNTIDIWYTTDIPFRGTPQPSVGIPDGLVLKTVRNGDRIIEAIDINKIKKPYDVLPTSWGESMDSYDFNYTIKQSVVTTVNVFDQETICFKKAQLPEQLESDKVYAAAGGTIILKKVKLPEVIKGRCIFAEVVQYSDGDAYDRTGSIFTIPVGKEKSFLDMLRNLKSVPSFHSGKTDYHGLVSTENFDVPVELMRFFTGFGVRKFNHVKVKGQDWVDSVLYKTEITAMAEHLSGEAWIGAYIGNWDAKGHRLSLKLKYYPDDVRRIYRSKPLFNTVNYMEQAGQPYPLFMLNDSLRVKFTLKEPVKNATLFYLTTGHGGWGNGDEFNQKINTIYLDDKQVISFVPWRDDCGTYRNWNPCSGNFSNGMSSSDLSRSNWCPATVTNPEYIFLGDLEAGEHTLVVKIPQGKPEGGSNSFWCISGTLLY